MKENVAPHYCKYNTSYKSIIHIAVCVLFCSGGFAHAVPGDIDNDGILDSTEDAACTTPSVGGLCDTDGDGVANSVDIDSDNDGFLDIVEGEADVDGDSVADYIDNDSDNDGIDDHIDTDDDGDGILDVDEQFGNGDKAIASENLFQPYDGGTFGFESGDEDQTPTVNPYPGAVVGGIFTDFYSIEFGFYGYVANAVSPRHISQFKPAIDPVYGVKGRFFASDPNESTPVLKTTLSNLLEGRTYEYAFWAANSEGGAPNEVDVLINGVNVFATGPLEPGPGVVPWERYSFYFVAPAGDVTIELASTKVGSRGNDFYLDNIEIHRIFNDTDADGIADYLDTDSDGDGIPDSVEAGADPSNPARSDGDALADFRDTDSDNDGLLDSLEAGADPTAPSDSDSDGTADYKELDSDNDGIADALEAGDDLSDPNDTDSDGLADFRDLDSDNDGITDVEESTVNTDDDSIPDRFDLDSDNDGIPDVVESGSGQLDDDNDGRLDSDVGTNGLADLLETTADSGEIDRNADGVSDSDDAPIDTDEDGLANFRDLDSDNDTVSDSIEAGVDGNHPLNTDNDSAPDYIDTDADGDGISDSAEVPDGPATDTDSDGLPDRIDTDSDDDGIPDGDESSNIDTDSDGLPNNRDPDSDNDGIPDLIEGLVDTDGDGIVDSLDLDSDNDGLSDVLEAGNSSLTPLAVLDTDGDGIADFLDRDSDNDTLSDTLESRGESFDLDRDGVIDGFNDMDGDGQHDSPTLAPLDSDMNGKPNHLAIDTDSDGLVDSVEGRSSEFRDVFGNLPDANEDGVVDAMLDSDEDNIPDSVDTSFIVGADLDGDSIVDFADIDFVPGSDTDGDGIVDTHDADANGDGFVDLFQDDVSAPVFEPLPDENGNGVADVLEANQAGALPLDGVIRAGLQGGGCSIDRPSAGHGLSLLLLGAFLLNVLRNRLPVQSFLIVGTGIRNNSKKSTTGAVAVLSMLLLGGIFTESRDTQAAEQRSNDNVVEANEPVVEAANSNQKNANDRRVYTGVGIGLSVLEPDTSEVEGIDVDDRTQVGVQITLGKDLGRRFSVEGHYADLGDAGLTQNAEIAYKELGVSALAYVGPLARREQRRGLLGFGRVGFGYLDTDASNNINFEKENDTHVVLGLGAEYASRSGLALRAETILFDADVYYTQLALVYRIGSNNKGNTSSQADNKSLANSTSAEKVQEPVALLAALPEDNDEDRVLDSIDQCPGTVNRITVDKSDCEVVSGTLQRVNFESGSAKLSRDSIARLDQVLSMLKAYGQSSILLTAHTDDQGSADANMALSKLRGFAVARYLISTGIKKRRFEVRAFGETRPIADNGTEEGRKINRRVELELLHDK